MSQIWKHRFNSAGEIQFCILEHSDGARTFFTPLVRNLRGLKSADFWIQRDDDPQWEPLPNPMQDYVAIEHARLAIEVYKKSLERNRTNLIKVHDA